MDGADVARSDMAEAGATTRYDGPRQLLRTTLRLVSLHHHDGHSRKEDETSASGGFSPPPAQMNPETSAVEGLHLV